MHCRWPCQVNWPATGWPINNSASYLGHDWFGRLSPWPNWVQVWTLIWPTPCRRMPKQSKPSLPCGEHLTPEQLIKSTITVMDDEFFSWFHSRYFLNEETGEVKKEGETYRRPVFAETLREIAQFGVDVFYNGSIGDKFVQDIQKRGGIITKEDLLQYRQVNQLSRWQHSLAVNNRLVPKWWWWWCLAGRHWNFSFDFFPVLLRHLEPNGSSPSKWNWKTSTFFIRSLHRDRECWLPTSSTSWIVIYLNENRGRMTPIRWLIIG